jgi:ubiquitin
MQIFLKQLNGTTKTFDVTHLESIANFKLRIREATGIPTQDMRLIYAGKQLEGKSPRTRPYATVVLISP